MATWALGQHCRSLTYIFIKQVRILLHIGLQEVCRSSNKKCVTSGRVPRPATKTETFWLIFKMPLWVSSPAISRNSQHAHRTSQHHLGTWHRNHDRRTWPWNNFSLKYPYIFQQTHDKNIRIYQVEAAILIWHQILITKSRNWVFSTFAILENLPPHTIFIPGAPWSRSLTVSSPTTLGSLKRE